MPIPITTAPSIWLRPASGLRMRPASMTATTRLTRNRAISGCHVTSTKCAPYEWLGGLGVAETGHGPEIAHPQQVRQRNAARRGLALGVHESIRVFELRGLSRGEL